jgi:hypothetical protein
MQAKRYSHQEVIPQRFPTNDSRSRDFALSAVQTGKHANMRGHMVWEGDSKPVGDAVARVKAALGNIKDKAQRGKAFAMAVRDVVGYGGELGIGTMRLDGFESLITDQRPEKEFNVGSGATPSDINRAEDAVRNPGRARDSRGPTLESGSTISGLQADLNRHYANQPKYQGRKFGEG